VTRTKTDAISRTAYVPNHALIHGYATTYNLNKQNLLAALAEFGALSEKGQEQLIKCLVQARSDFQLTAMERITPSQQRNTAVKQTKRRYVADCCWHFDRGQR